MRKTTAGVQADEKLARDIILAQSSLQQAMTAYLKRYLTANGLPVREEVIDRAFISLISGARPPVEMQELVQQYVDILRAEAAVIDPFKVVMTVKLLSMTGEGLASEAMGISKYLFGVGIRVMSINTPVPEPRELVAMINQSCNVINAIRISPPQTSLRIPLFLGDGRYQVKQEIGRGAFGAVHKALDTTLRRYVAIKRLVGDVTKPHFAIRIDNLLREAQMLARLSHPNIVQVFDIVREQGAVFIIMEYVSGGTLKTLIDDGVFAQLPLRDRLCFLINVCQGVACAHERGVLHLDLKPANILVTEPGAPIPKITDFGIARLMSPDGEAMRGGGGTPLYMAPEQRVPSMAVTQAADVYALAKVVHEVITGEIGMAVDLNHESLPPTLRPVLSAAVKADPASRLSHVAPLCEALVKIVKTMCEVTQT